MTRRLLWVLIWRPMWRFGLDLFSAFVIAGCIFLAAVYLFVLFRNGGYL
ncbi:hypothetical protein [Bradyrhizobium sp. 33ap4]|nr:hypothetical protein [Bradyrhizobium sp. 33ap4]